jgi:hypothetical protein
MLEKGQHTAANAVKSAVSDVAGSVAGQIGVKTEASPDNQGGVQNQGQTNAQNQTQKPTETSQVRAASTEETKQFVKEFYAPSVELPEETIQQAQQKDQLETQQKLANLRQELHKKGYYEPLIAYETKKPQEEEENTSEKLEREEKEEEQKKMELEEKKAQEKQDLAKTRAQTKVEANRGVAG